MVRLGRVIAGTIVIFLAGMCIGGAWVMKISNSIIADIITHPEREYQVLGQAYEIPWQLVLIGIVALFTGGVTVYFGIREHV